MKVKIYKNNKECGIDELEVFDKITITGYIYTARDAAHKLIAQAINNGEKLPFELSGATIYYAGPTKAPQNLPIGSCGPTTSSRMDVFTPTLLDKGLKIMIGKGRRNAEVVESIKKNNAVYLCAIGGAGALYCKCIKSLEVIAFDFLGCESVKKLYVEDFPLIVATDSKGNEIYQ
ncbi:MAG: FumA C-terminus/TtdB family hydratase beta subunit [Oscillospiraceae bacterium]